MSAALFNAIVEWLQGICATTGLRYSEINILIYCGFIPATWFGIVYLRRRRWFWLLALHLLLPTIYYFEKRPLAKVSENFYAANIRALEELGKTTGLGYIGISLVIGVVVPILIYLILFCFPKRWILGCYGLMMIGNLVWYYWALRI